MIVCFVVVIFQRDRFSILMRIELHAINQECNEGFWHVTDRVFLQRRLFLMN